MDEHKDKPAWMELESLSYRLENAIGLLWCIYAAATDGEIAKHNLGAAIMSYVDTLSGIQETLDSVWDRMLTEHGERKKSC